ncbi:hypothetical protein LSH36_251g00043 [Paralvinella palmiformis]|uniref:Uncharacterized protein n=1 Tax=Paralvinella palmiformis TaxID=53620 RepID=A0AAD9N5F7_9ANNE|nr:hypothetical protein LSH36_251g00043 [Paralvinella palmiformis]
MCHLINLALLLFLFHGIFAVAPKMSVADDLQPHNKLPTLTITDPGIIKWQSDDETPNKYKDAAWVIQNEVDPAHKEMVDDNPLSTTTTVGTTTTTTLLQPMTRTPNEKDVLLEWMSLIPRDIFNVKNRIKLATVFLEARSKDDVINKLARATGNEKLRHGRRRRKLRRPWPVPYHPTVRFVANRSHGRRHN